MFNYRCFPCFRPNEMIPEGNVMYGYPYNQNIYSPSNTMQFEPYTLPDSSLSSQEPETLQDTSYIPGFLKTQIGKDIRIEFLIGTNAPLIDRTGKLINVGASYLIIQLVETNELQLCDLYSIKFITIFGNN